jgi:hypothetical protein
MKYFDFILIRKLIYFNELEICLYQLNLFYLATNYSSEEEK